MGVCPPPHPTDASRTSSGKRGRANILHPSFRSASTRAKGQISPPLQIASIRAQERNSGIPDVVQRKSEEDDILATTKVQKRAGDLQRTSRDIAFIIDREFSVESLSMTPRKYARFSRQRGTTIEAQKKANTIQSTKGKELPALLKLQF